MKGDFVLKTFCGKIGFEQKGFKKMFMGFIIIFLRNLGTKNPMILRKRNIPLKFCSFKRFILLHFLKEAPTW